MNKTALNLLACPRCQAKLRLDDTQHYLVCDHENVAYIIQQDIAILLPESAQPLQQLLSREVKE